LAMLAAGEACAQSAVTGVPNAMQGFSQNRDQPIQIEAASLEMHDKKKEATFSGNVKVVQGDTTMTSKTLVVFYESGRGAPRRVVEAAGGVLRIGWQRHRRTGGEGLDQIGTDPVCDPWAWRQLLDQAAGSARQCGRDPEGAGRDG